MKPIATIEVEKRCNRGGAMNDAVLSFSADELALLRQAVLHLTDEADIRGMARLRYALERIEPDQPFHFDAVEIAAADGVLTRVSAEGALPFGLDGESQRNFHHLKGVIAAAAVD
jgi:hypothetical protein